MAFDVWGSDEDSVKHEVFLEFGSNPTSGEAKDVGGPFSKCFSEILKQVIVNVPKIRFLFDIIDNISINMFGVQFLEIAGYLGFFVAVFFVDVGLDPALVGKSCHGCWRAARGLRKVVACVCGWQGVSARLSYVMDTNVVVDDWEIFFVIDDNGPVRAPFRRRRWFLVPNTDSTP
jgi:hypothetical protein